MARKPSFFERLTGTIRLDDYDPETGEIQSSEPTEEDEEEVEAQPDEQGKQIYNEPQAVWNPHEQEEEQLEGQLSVDLYETPDELIIKSMIAGVRPDDLDVSITRENVTIKGERNPEATIDDDDYHMRELYWGPFSRSVNLPQEIEAEEAEAVEKHGLLIVRLPKIDKHRETKLKVKSA